MVSKGEAKREERPRLRRRKKSLNRKTWGATERRQKVTPCPSLPSRIKKKEKEESLRQGGDAAGGDGRFQRRRRKIRWRGSAASRKRRKEEA